ncbi:hypothetical protein CKA32_004877 [Geitlerinema sp. FC II]|nr:hypothetical protein CKA32_004877 [Geitlerinema sp. FC II]
MELSERLQATDGIAYASLFLGSSHSNLGEKQTALMYY